ncbi:MAG TPA: rhodanese-like domain-containing protein [Acidobacteriota bacterium]|nr:rhodanese-like domain-containing protein [Acidobacteriota bacterium]
MTKKTLAYMILMVVMLSSATAFSADEAYIVLPEIPRISVEELKGMIDDGEDVVTVDVRDSHSYRVGRIKGSVNIYYDSAADPMHRQLIMMALPTDRLIVFYCDCTDDASSAYMAHELHKLGYDRDKAKVLRGGSLRWVELDYPLTSSD